jgi:hypothetical protein
VPVPPLPPEPPVPPLAPAAETETSVGVSLEPVAFAQKPNVVDEFGAMTAFQESDVAVTSVPDWLLAALQSEVIDDWFRLMTACQLVVAVEPVFETVTFAQ